jgi:large subunit ribosomal protein L24e
MKRVAEIKAKRELAFWKNRFVLALAWSSIESLIDDPIPFIPLLFCRMAGNKARAITQQTSEINRHIELIQPRSKKPLTIAERDVIRQKIKVNAAKRPGVLSTKALKKSALIPVSGGVSMGMETD